MRFLAIAILLTFGFTARTNELLNGSFEQKFTGWRPYWVKVSKGDTHKLDNTIYRDGKYSFRADVKNKDSRLALFSDAVTVTPGETYRITFHYYTETGTMNGTFSFRLQGSDQSKQHVGYYCRRELPPTGNMWVKGDIIATIPDNVTNLKLEFNFIGPVEVWLDQVELVKAPRTDVVNLNGLYPDNRPLSEELYISGTEPAKPRTYPYWTYYVGENYRDTAAIIGVEHSNEGEFEEAGKYNLAPFYHTFFRNYPELTRKHKTPVLYYPLVNALAQSKQKGFDQQGKPWGNDPEFIRIYLDVIAGNDFTTGLPKDIPRLIFIADEWLGYNVKPELAPRNPEYWNALKPELKAKYGFSKFDMPESAGDSDPFKRIAWLRWNADLSVENLKKISSALRRKYPDARIVGFDEWAAATPHDWSRLGSFIDIQPGQVLPLESGYRKFAPAYISKFHADLTGKEVYPYLQFIKYPSSITVDRLYEWCDLLFQGGAEGIFIGAVEWFDRAVGHPKFSAPEKWEAMLNIIRRTQSMPKLQHPQDSRMALHFGSYTLMTKLRNPENQLYPIFALLGPRCRSWFTITDDFQIDRDPKHWDKYQVVVISEEKYISASMQAAIDRLLERGGTLVVLNPDAFRFRIDGTDLSDYRKKLFGAEVSQPNTTSLKITTANGVTLPNTDSSNHKLHILAPHNTKILATFDDHSPALIEHKAGKGKVWLAAFSAANDYSVDDPGWVAQWRQWLSTELGVKIDEPIWRFQIPRDPLKEKIRRKYACVSGNGMEYIRNYPNTSMNLKDAGVSYEYKIPPVKIPDSGTKLTDRIKAKALKKNSAGRFIETDKVKMENWVAEFGPAETDANEITFTFNRKYPLRHGRIFFSGFLPECRVEIKIDGRWHQQTEIPAQNAGRDIKLVEFPLNTDAQHLRLVFRKRPANTSLTLVEMDFWALK